MTRLIEWGKNQAWLLLALTMLMWAGNSVASRAIAGQMSPMAVVSLRWLIVCGVLWALMKPDFSLYRAVLMRHRAQIVLMGLFGFTGFNALFYIAAYHTTAINLTLLQSSIPAFVLAGSALLFRTGISAVQITGLAMTLVGVCLIATRGDLALFREMAFNSGDLLILLACLFYAGYTLALRKRPALPALVFFAALAAVAFVSSLPLLAIEVFNGQAYWPSVKGWLILGYISIAPSLLSQIFFIRGVELIGPGRAGIFTNLVPVFGAVLAVVILGEEFHLYHAAALTLALGGIWLSEQAGAQARKANQAIRAAP